MTFKTNIVYTLCHSVASHILSYNNILLAFSGGLDSTVLLDILLLLRNKNNFFYKLPILKLRAVHIHHGLHCNADQWATHCAYECKWRNVTLSIKHISGISKNIEAEARDARYHVLANMLEENEVLLTAQHQDDQAETVILALKRGSGPTGLSGMSINTSFHGHRLIRPLLEKSQRELKEYARERNLKWIEDDSNENIRFDRNFLRLMILPLLRSRWPQFSYTVSRSAQLCAEQEQLLDELLEKTLNELIQWDGSLYMKSLMSMSNIKRAAILRRWLASHGVKMPARHQLDRLWKEVALSRRDAVSKIQCGNVYVRRFRNHLYVVPHVSNIFNDKVNKVAVFYWIQEEKALKLPMGLGMLFRNKIENDDVVENTLGMITQYVVTVRAPCVNERVSIRFGTVCGLLYIVGRRRGRTLKKIWQELNIPPWERNRIPLLFYNEKLIAALEVFVTLEGMARTHHAIWNIFWQKK